MGTNTSTDRPRVSMCCEPGLYLSNSTCYADDPTCYADDSTCYADDSFSAAKMIFPGVYYPNLSISSMGAEEFVPRYSRTGCFVDTVYRWHSDLADNVLIYLLENGSIYVNHSINGGNSFDPDSYCLASRVTGNEVESVVSVCPQPLYIKFPRIMIVEMILPILSIPFVVATFIIHALLPEMRNVQGYIFRSFLAALLITFVTTSEITADPRCIPVISITAQLSLVASFFWMNVMAFDIWWTFGGLGSLQRNSILQDRTRYIIYTCYAWGIPMIIFGTGVVLDVLRVESTILIRPGLIPFCRYTSSMAYNVYYVGPAGITTILNFLFFASTTIKIIRHKRTTDQQLRGTDSQRHVKKKERFNLYLKLFIVMGISRIASIIAWRYYDQLPDYIWYCLVSEANLQGPIVFVIYVWKPNTKAMLSDRLGSLNIIFRRGMNSKNSNQSLSDTGETTPSVASTTASVISSSVRSNGHEEPTISETNA